jgi:hypothetical protein
METPLDRVRSLIRANETKPAKLDNRHGALLLDEMAYYCERNRIDLSGLLASKESMGMGLWPLILSKVRHTSLVFALLHSKPDLMATAPGMSANCCVVSSI